MTQEQLDKLADSIPKDKIWEHHTSKALYTVIMLANTEDGKQDRYPMTVVYQNVHNGKVYARRADDWHRSMTVMVN